MARIMGEPFYGTGSPPEGYKPGDYVEFLDNTHGWQAVARAGACVTPSWVRRGQYRLEADHPCYLPPVWCLDRAAQLAGRGGWGDGDFGSQRLKKSIIAHARTLHNGCEPMQEPVDPLVEALREFGFCATSGKLARALRARFEVTEKAK